MRDHLRRAVAFVAGRVLGGQTVSAVLDQGDSRTYYFTGDVGPDGVSLFDHTEGTHLTGTTERVYHHKEAGHITLTWSGSSFTGYYHRDGSHLAGEVTGSTVTIFDHGTGKEYVYTL